MNILNKFSWSLCLTVCSGLAFAQNPMINDQAQNPDMTMQTEESAGVNSNWRPSLVKDGVIDYVPHVNEVLEWNEIREIDIAWKTRVWRQIDTRQKQNYPFNFEGDEFSGGGAFIEILMDGLKKGKMQAYVDDRFTTTVTHDEIRDNILGSEDSTLVTNPITGEETWQYTQQELNVNDITQYQIKEDWIFDRNAGRLIVRIVGIAPLIDRYEEESGRYLYSTPMFWLYYPDIRSVLGNYEVYNPLNDVHRISWADYLEGRYFSSYVVKTSTNNPRGLKFGEGLRGLQEGQNAMDAIISREMAMWER